MILELPEAQGLIPSDERWHVRRKTASRVGRVQRGGSVRARTSRTGATLATMQETIRTLLQDTETWAVVGCSPDPRRDSHRIAGLLQSNGKRMIPVNPAATEIHGERAYASLLDVPGTQVDVVDIFRRSSEAGAHVDEAIAIGARAVWMQLGVVDRAAAARAVEAGLLVVMDRCPAIEWRRLQASGTM